MGTMCPFVTQYFIQKLSRNQRLKSTLYRVCPFQKCLFACLFVFCLAHIGIPTGRCPDIFMKLGLDLAALKIFVCLFFKSSWDIPMKLPECFIKIRLDLTDILTIKFFCLLICLFVCFFCFLLESSWNAHKKISIMFFEDGN